MKKTIYTIMALALAALAAAGCAKQEVDGVLEGPGCLMTIEPEVAGTKATLINGAEGLQGQGFGLSIYNGATAYKDKVEMKFDNGAWVPVEGTMDWRWPSGTDYTFYAWSPADLPVGTVTSAGIPAFTYDGISTQKDIMLGYYSGTGSVIGDVCTAPVKFSHALASVRFTTGSMTGLGNITAIELGGIVMSGTCTPTMSGSSTSFVWSSLGTGTTAVSQTGFTAVASSTPGAAIGDPFLVLPQSTDLTVKLTDAAGKVVKATIPSPALTVGKTSVYKINYDGQTVSFSVSIEGWQSGQNEDVTVGEKTNDIYISSFEDLMDFKSLVESGKNLSGITVYFKSNIIIPAGAYLGINDSGVLDDVTIEGGGFMITSESESDMNLVSGLFSNIASDNVTIRYLTLRNIKVTVGSTNYAGPLVGNFTGSNLSIDSCNIGGVTIESTSSNGIVGGLIGECDGNVEISGCKISGAARVANCIHSAVIGKATGEITVTIDGAEVKDFAFMTTGGGKMFGVYIGALDDCQGMNITLKDCKTQSSTQVGLYPSPAGNPDGRFYGSGSGELEGVFVTGYHFYAIACNSNASEYAQATVSMTGMKQSMCNFQ